MYKFSSVQVFVASVLTFPHFVERYQFGAMVYSVPVVRICNSHSAGFSLDPERVLWGVIFMQWLAPQSCGCFCEHLGAYLFTTLPLFNRKVAGITGCQGAADRQKVKKRTDLFTPLFMPY